MRRNNLWGLWAGAALIVLGFIFLLGMLVQIDLMHYLWPFFILAAGAAFFIGMAAGGRAMGALAVPGSVIITVGLILFFQNLFDIWSTWAYAWTLIIAGAGVGLVIFGQWSQLPDLRRAGRVVITVGLVLFFVFGVIFELLFSLLGRGGLGGIFWAILLILVGLYVLFGRQLLGRWIEGGPVMRSSLDFSQQAAAPYQSGEAPAAAGPAAFPAYQAGPGAAVYPAQVAGIRRVEYHALGDMTILQGEREGLEIEASQAVRERIRSEVHGDTLEIRYDQAWLDWLQPRFWNISNPLRFTLTVRDLSYLDAGGMGNLVVPSLAAAQFELVHSGAGNVTIRNLAATDFKATQAGLGNVEVEGRADRQIVNLTGTGSYHAGRLESREASVRMSGLGSATVWVHESLEASLTGAGSIEYYGSPHVTQQTTGLGSVRRLGDR